MIESHQSSMILPATISTEKQYELEHFLRGIKQSYPLKDQLAFICIGTDRSTGDSFGPLMGTMLKQLGFEHVYGTLEEPCDADHVQHMAQEAASKNKIVIAIDACLGTEASIGSFICNHMPLVPGAAVGRKLPPIGDYSIAAVVNKKGLKSYWQLQHTSLFYIYRMVHTLYQAFQSAWEEEVKR